MSATAVLTYADTVLRYFNPSRSPFYAIIAVGTISLEFAYRELEGSRWYIVACVIMIVLGIGTWFSLTDKAKMTKEEYLDQLFFSRSICVSSAVIAITYFAINYEDDWRFYFIFFMSLFQAITFILYIWARKDSPQELTDTNYVQLGLITTTFFIGAMFLLVEPTYVAENPKIDWTPTLRKNFPAFYMIFLWLSCARVWWRLILKLVVILERREDGSNKANSADAKSRAAD